MRNAPGSDQGLKVYFLELSACLREEKKVVLGVTGLGFLLCAFEGLEPEARGIWGWITRGTVVGVGTCGP